MLEILFRTSLFFWYIKILLRSFSFWHIENLKMSSPNFSLDMLISFRLIKKNMKCEKRQLIIAKINFWDIFIKFIFKFVPDSQEWLPQSLVLVQKNKFRKITWKLNYLALMLIEWTLLNEFETPIKKRDFKCKTTHKLRQKQFNILNDEYWKFLIYNNLSFTTTNFEEVCLDIAFAKINSVIFLF